MLTSLRRWLPLLMVVLALVVFLIVDNRVKAGKGLGFCPADAQWTLAMVDVARARQGLEQSDTYRQIREEWKPLDSLDLAVRKASGISPMGLRWTLWMGSTLLSAGGRTGTGGCVYPGLLLRAGHRLNMLFSEPQDGLYRFGRHFYAWREGFLIFSTSAEYVAASLDALPFAPQGDLGGEEVHWHWRGDGPAVFLRFRAAEGIPVEGWADVQVSERADALEVPRDADGETLLELAATQCADIDALWALVAMPLAGLEERQFVPLPALRATPHLRDEALAAAEQCVLTLLAGPAAEQPDPRYLLRVRPLDAGQTNGHPLAGLPDTQRDFPSLGRAGPDWYVAETPDLVEAGAVAEPVRVDADASVRIVWRNLGQAAEARVMRRAENMDSEEQRLDYLRAQIPAARGLARAGTLDVQGRMEQGRLVFTGHLARVASY